jgi:phage terminase large subunit
MAGKTLKVNIECKPSPKQAIFMKAKTRYVAYGGARNGGKSWVIRKMAILLACCYKGMNILLIRRTYAELNENHTLPLINELKNIAKYKSDDKAFTFPNGSRLKLGYCDNEGDVLQYQGQKYDTIFVDEATQLTEYMFDCLRACNIGTSNNFPHRFYLTCNPGGVGHAWVKRLFIDRDYQGEEREEDYTFIQALPTDNSYTSEEDLKMLDSLPFELREAWRYGKWDSFAGQYFNEWNEDIHTCNALHIQPYWRKYMAVDYGFDRFIALWIAVDEYSNAFIYREIAESGLIVSDAAKRIITAEENDQIGQKITRYAPPDLWNRQKDTGKSMISIFAESKIYFSKSDSDRENGWIAIKEWLNIQDKKSKLKIVRSACPELVKCLPLMQFDKTKTNDCSTNPHNITHAPDALRYFCIMRTCPAKKPQDKIFHNDFFKQDKQEAFIGGSFGSDVLGGNVDLS